MEIYIIRHTPVAIGKDTCYGQTNVPLHASFLQDVQFIKRKLPEEFDVVFSSPLDRCLNLASALGCETIIQENALMEMNFGDWENKKWNDINPIDLTNWMNEFVNTKTPNGENLVELFQRVSVFLDHLRNQSFKKVAIVTHAGVIRCIWAYLLEIPLKNSFKIPVGYNEVFILNLTDEKQSDTIRQTK